ncbi:hypothetical protein GGTG_10990 [Gaeumannomyces tritici R3-111a-1]|uniref:Heterokaryon incompatibility domain-containing protein n=1 Tax=Gaeumannomyces tritici (strain R3-111a-1) TaxID=644352 RepID=J3PBW6_GAET3|nr:hypothetical protein GGTG_10990 [Gaeumannomyces tritici R3-111a-1]EJT71736.1 hypothetical protein GGTG_10990 [Gaeumannomyces tritici R3-111a-1]
MAFSAREIDGTMHLGNPAYAHLLMVPRGQEMWTKLTRDVDSSSPDASGLCTVCRKVDFYELAFGLGCGCHQQERSQLRSTALVPVRKQNQTSDSGNGLAAMFMTYEIGTLRGVARNAGTCHGCDLILSAARYGVDPTDEKSLDHEVCIHHDELAAIIVGNWFGGSLALVDSPKKLGHARILPPLRGKTVARVWEPRVAREVHPEIDVGLIRNWMRHCDTTHGADCAKMQLGEAAKMRCIDVQEYRITAVTSEEKYLALSYVWGTAGQPCLRTENLKEYSEPQGLREVALPRTIREAIELTAALGERYLWVDSLCIVQNDPIDKNQQLSIMDAIYSVASVVLIAASGADCWAGLPGVASNPRTLVPQCIRTVNGNRLAVVAPSLVKAIKHSQWNTRGWTYQEAKLARRTLVFTDRLVYWACQVDSWREDLELARDHDGDGDSGSNGRACRACPTAPPRCPVDSQNSFSTVDPDGVVKCPIDSYCEMVANFSRRRFTNQGDALWAFSGMLKSFARGMPNVHIWGLPLQELDIAMVWQEHHLCPCPHPRRQRCEVAAKNGVVRTLPFPSWSWLSWQAAIRYDEHLCDTIASEVEWHDPVDAPDAFWDIPPRKASGEAGTDGALDGSASSPKDMSYGLLKLTASVGKITVRQQVQWRNQDGSKAQGDYYCIATMHSASDEPLGKVWLLESYFGGLKERQADVVLLSTNLGVDEEQLKRMETNHDHSLDVERSPQSQNVMFIREENGITYRVGLAKIAKGAWETCQSSRRTLVLG